MNHDEMIAVIQAHKDGKGIQYRYRSKVWTVASTPSWSFSDTEYRVKPAEPREWTRVVCKRYTPHRLRDATCGNCEGCISCEMIKVREVLE